MELRKALKVTQGRWYWCHSIGHVSNPVSLPLTVAHGTQKPTCQNTQLFTWHLLLCSKYWLHLWRTSHLLWPNDISLQNLLRVSAAVERWTCDWQVFKSQTARFHVTYKLLSVTYKVLTTPSLHTFIISSMFNVLAVLALHPSLLLIHHRHHLSSVKITDRCIRYTAPCILNHPPLSLRQPHSGAGFCISDSPYFFTHHFFVFDSPLCSSITPSLFHSRLKTYTCFTNPTSCSFTSSSQTDFTDYCPDRFLWATRFLFLVFPIFRLYAM